MATVTLGVGAEDGGELTFKTFFCHNGAPILRFQTKEPSIRIIRWTAKFDGNLDSILQIENRFRSGE